MVARHVPRDRHPFRGKVPVHSAQHRLRQTQGSVQRVWSLFVGLSVALNKNEPT